MTPRLRGLSGRDLIKGLRDLGFEVVNMHGSHAKLRRVGQDGERQILTIPLHDDLKPGTLVAIYRQVRRYVAEQAARPLFYR